MDGIIIAIISGSFAFVTFLLTRYFTKKDETEEKNEKKEDKYRELEKKQNAIAKDVEELKKLVSEMIELQKDAKEDTKIMQRSLRDSLRNFIICIYNRYEELGYIPIHERENLHHLVEEYYALKGNGVVPSLVEKLDSLPTEKPAE